MRKWPIGPDTKSRRCLAALADGPATTAEIAAELDLPTKIVCAHLGNWETKGKVVKRQHESKPRKANLWMLPEHAKD